MSSCFSPQAPAVVTSSHQRSLRQPNSFCVLCFNADTEDMDNERRETMEADVAGLHRFFSKHLEIPGHKDLLTLFSQVLQSDPGSHFPAFSPEEMIKNEICRLCRSSDRLRATVSL